MIERDQRERAVDRAYRDHANQVFRVAYGILRDPDEALDATHDAFARAWERWEQYDSNRPILSWLHGIVTHLALDRVRRRRVQRLALLQPARTHLALAEHEVDPADEVAIREFVDQALDGLRPAVRAALVLRHYYGYDYAQIGQMLGMTTGTVGSTLSRAHTAIRKRLEAAETRDERPTPEPLVPFRSDATTEPPDAPL